MPSPSPYLLLSLSAETQAAKLAVTEVLSSRTFGWAVKHVTAVVKAPSMTVIEELIADLNGIEQGLDPEFTCVATLVPFKQMYFALDTLDDHAAVVAITGREPS